MYVRNGIGTGEEVRSSGSHVCVRQAKESQAHKTERRVTAVDDRKKGGSRHEAVGTAQRVGGNFVLALGVMGRTGQVRV